MNDTECPHCGSPLKVEDATYTRAVCIKCRTIVDVKPIEVAAKPSGSSPRTHGVRTTAARPGSSPRNVTSKTKSKPNGQDSLVIPAAVAALLLFSIGAFALTRSRSSTEASINDSATPSQRETSDSKRIALTTTPQELKSTVSEPASAPKPQPTPEVRRETAPAAEPVRSAPEPTPTPTVSAPEKRGEEPTKPAAMTEKGAAPTPTQNISELLKAPVTRDAKRDDDEALLEKEDAARAKAKTDKAAGADMKPKDELRSKLTTEEPAAPVAPPKSLAAKAGMASGTAVPAPGKALDVPELAPVCATCMGTGFIPIGGPRHLVRGLKDPPPAGAMLCPWKQCSKCKGGVDDVALADVETSRMKDPAASTAADGWTQMAGGKLDTVETRHITFRSQLAPAQSKVVADMLEQLTEHLQQITHVTVLTPTRPGTHELFLFTDRGAYEKVRDTVAPNPDIDRAALSKISGMSGRNKSLFHVQPPQKPEHMGLFLMGRMSMTEASDAKAPFWLVEGFAAYCENAITKKNLCYTISYELNDIKFSPNWNDDVRKFALKKQLKPWKDVFSVNGAVMKPLEYLTCYSMVSFLIKSDPQRFTRLVLAVREGHPSPMALKIAYGRDVEELQRLWAAWALTAK